MKINTGNGIYVVARIVLVLIAAVTAAVYPTRLLAQDALFEGQVVDPSGFGVPGAKIQLSTGTEVMLTTWADATGSFRVDPSKLISAATVPTPVFIISITAGGFRKETSELTLGVSSATFTLQLAPVSESITVQSDVPGNALPLALPNRSVLNAGDIERGNAADIGEALSRVDGVWMKRKASIENDVVVRGFQEDNINLLIDGARVYGACPSQMDPPAGHVDLSQVESVEIIKGPFDVRNEGSLGATVSVLTKAPEERLSFTPVARFGSFGQYNAGLDSSYANNWVQVSAGYSYRTSDPYTDGHGQSFTQYTNYSAIGQNARAYDTQGGWFKATFTPTDSEQVSLSYTRDQNGLVLYPYLAMDSNYDNTDRATVAYQGKNLSIFKSVQMDAYYTNVIHVMSDSERTSAMNGVPTMTAPTSARAVGGHLEGFLGSVFSVGIETFYRNWNVSGSMVMSGMTMLSHSLPDVETWGTGAFATYQHAFTPRLILKSGVRYDYATNSIGLTGASTDLYYKYYGTRKTSSNDSYVSGNARLSYVAMHGVTLFAGVGSSGRNPNAEELFFARAGASSMTMGGMGMSGVGSTMGIMQMNATVGNPDLHAPRNTEGDAGAEFKAGRLRFTANLFYSNIQNFIMLAKAAPMNTLSGTFGMPGMGSGSMELATTYNNVSARIYGGELSYDLKLSRGFSLIGNLSESIGITNSKPGAGIYNTNLPEMPPVRGTATFRYIHRNMFAEFGTLIADRQTRVDTDLLETPTAGYAVFHTKLGVTYRKLRVNFGVDNLLDRFYYQNLSYVRDPFSAGIRLPEPGRSFFGEVRLLL